MLKSVEAGQLEIAYEEIGSIEGKPIVLLHGFPYDVRAYDDVAAILADAGGRVIVPYLRGFGPTRFLSEKTLRSGQQAVLAHDLLALMDGLNISQAALAGSEILAAGKSDPYSLGPLAWRYPRPRGMSNENCFHN